MTATTSQLRPVDLPIAEPVTRTRARKRLRRKAPSLALIVIGVVLTATPIAGGLFAGVAGGRQMIDNFAPRLDPDHLARYHHDVALLGGAARDLETIYRTHGVRPGTFPGIDVYRASASSITQRADHLLARIESGVPDFDKLSSVGGFDRSPFLLVSVGVVSAGAGVALLTGTVRTRRQAFALALVAAAGLAAYPFVGGLADAATPGHRLIARFEPAMNQPEVRQLQADFVSVVGAVGELDTRFQSVPRAPGSDTNLAALQRDWPAVSGDLADLVGTINDNLDNYRGLRRIDDSTTPLGVAGFVALPWALLGLATVIAVLGLAAYPRPIKENS